MPDTDTPLGRRHHSNVTDLAGGAGRGGGDGSSGGTSDTAVFHETTTGVIDVECLLTPRSRR